MYLVSINDNSPNTSYTYVTMQKLELQLRELVATKNNLEIFRSKKDDDEYLG